MAEKIQINKTHLIYKDIIVYGDHDDTINLGHLLDAIQKDGLCEVFIAELKKTSYFTVKVTVFPALTEIGKVDVRRESFNFDFDRKLWVCKDAKVGPTDMRDYLYEQAHRYGWDGFYDDNMRSYSWFHAVIVEELIERNKI